MILWVWTLRKLLRHCKDWVNILKSCLRSVISCVKLPLELTRTSGDVLSYDNGCIWLSSMSWFLSQQWCCSEILKLGHGGCLIYCGVDEIELQAVMRQNVGTKFQGLVFMEQISTPLVTFVGLDFVGTPRSNMYTPPPLQCKTCIFHWEGSNRLEIEFCKQYNNASILRCGPFDFILFVFEFIWIQVWRHVFRQSRCLVSSLAGPAGGTTLCFWHFGIPPLQSFP